MRLERETKDSLLTRFFKSQIKHLELKIAGTDDEVLKDIYTTRLNRYKKQFRDYQEELKQKARKLA